MLDFKLLENQIYLYDGSFDGLLTIVFDCYVSKTIPVEITTEQNYIPNFLSSSCYISTNEEKAKRIWNGCYKNISYIALYDCYHAFLSYQKGKEIAIVKYLLHGFVVGATISKQLAIDYVLQVTKLKKNVIR